MHRALWTRTAKKLQHCLGGVLGEASCCPGDDVDYKPFAILSKTRSARHTCDLPDNTEVASCGPLECCDLFHGVTGNQTVSHVSLVFKNVPMDELVTTKQLLRRDDHLMLVLDLILIGPHGMAVQQLALTVSSSEKELIHVV